MRDRGTVVLVAVLVMLVAAVGWSGPAGAAAGPKVTITADWMVKAGAATTARGTVSEGSGHTVYLQYRVSATKDSWSTITTAKVAANGASGKISVAFVPKSGEHVYRVVIKKGALRAVSNTITIRTTSGSVYLAKARHYMKKYCPLTPLAATLPTGGLQTGLAHMSYEYRITHEAGGRVKWAYSWNQRIQLRPGMDDALLRAVSLHECAHVVQYRQLVKGGAFYEKQFAAVDKLYKGNGTEKQADCMAAYLLKTTKYLYYASSCSKAQTEAGRLLWANYGSRYQSPNYSWVLYTG